MRCSRREWTSQNNNLSKRKSWERNTTKYQIKSSLSIILFANANTIHYIHTHTHKHPHKAPIFEKEANKTEEGQSMCQVELSTFGMHAVEAYNIQSKWWLACENVRKKSGRKTVCHEIYRVCSMDVSELQIWIRGIGEITFTWLSIASHTIACIKCRIIVSTLIICQKATLQFYLYWASGTLYMSYNCDWIR